jgi:hypothetical protein
MPTFPNPTIYDVPNLNHLGTLREAARVAGVKPGTIRVWESRGKIERMPIGHGAPLYHLPTIKAAATSASKFTPADPAANSRGPHKRETKAA